MNGYVISIDQSTQSTKAILFDEKGNIVRRVDKKHEQLINEKGYGIGNIDCTIIAQSPKMAPHIQNMRENIAKALNTSIENINVKATTEEGLGFTGAKEGIAAQSICLLVKVDK